MIELSSYRQHSLVVGRLTRGARLAPRLALLVLLLLCLSLAASIGTVGAAFAHGTERKAAVEPETTDLDLYRGIAAQVRSGRDYYVVAIDAQRAGNYPVRPFFTVRLPTLTWLIAALSPLGAQILILLLVAATVKVWSVRLSALPSPSPSRWRTVARIFLIVFGVAPATIQSGIWFTEIWAGLLIALSLALRRPGRWGTCVTVGLMAGLVRELALPYLLAMGLLAALDGQRREALGWGLAVGLCVLALVCHAAAVHALTHVGDLGSPGWTGGGGWGFFISSCLDMTLLTLLPVLVVAVLLPLSFFGLAAWAEPLGLRAFVTLCGYTLMIAIFARPDNNYWVWMVSPILVVGLLFVPRAIADLARSLRGRPISGGGLLTEDLRV